MKEQTKGKNSSPLTPFPCLRQGFGRQAF